MTIYIPPDFLADALDLDHVPDEFELFPDDPVHWIDSNPAKIDLLGTRRRYSVGVSFGDDSDGRVGIAIWTATDTANQNLARHAEDDGILRVSVGAVTFSARLTCSRHSRPKYLGDLFSENPITWGTRGDPYLWADLIKRFKETPLPDSVDELDVLIADAFLDLTGGRIESARPIFVQRYDKGGMSSGHVCTRTWRENHMPMLHERFESAKRNPMQNPKCPECHSRNVRAIEYTDPYWELTGAPGSGEVVQRNGRHPHDGPWWACDACEYEW